MDESTSFDVMLWVPVRRRNGRVGRWFLVGMHRDETEGLRQFLAVADEFRSRRAVILLVRSVLDRTTGRFRDRILRSTGPAPLIDRREMEQLDPSARRSLAARMARRDTESADEPLLRLPGAISRPSRPSYRLYGYLVAALGLAAAVALATLPR
ncbi:hypothetical protein [Elioraea thermophila]|uniref:hypothetical protein n=1 Tax=Elioraea thermophila TaxID=2185104 RepID=UPI000DF49CCF|nr:hypothetical protein [Elioraea thermophila]